MKKLFLLLALLGIVATGCSKDEVDKGNNNKTEKPNENEGGNQVEDYVFVTDSQNNYSVVANGGEVVVTIATNLEYSVYIPANAQSWISVADTRTMRLEKLVFTIAANDTTEDRSAVVKLVGEDETELHSITFVQQGKNPEVEIPADTTEAIKFQDANTKLICTLHWDANEDGELSYDEAAAVTDLGTAFKGSSIMAFTELKYFTGLSGIADNAFENCVSLVKITLPKQITSIGSSAFDGCNNLKSITIPNGVTEIGGSAFYNCSSLTSVYISDIAAWCNISFSSSNSNPLYYANNLYLNNELVTDLVIPDSVTTIGDYAFYSCDSLTSVTIPDSVTTIGYRAFSSCYSLTSVTIPDSVTTIGEGAFRGCSSLTSVTIPDSVTTIGDEAFYYCSSLTSVTIPDSVITIGDEAFYCCTGELIINSKIIETDYTDINYPSYDGWLCGAKFTKLTIGDSVTTIGYCAFALCSSLTSVTIPDSVTTIGKSAFSDCDSLTSVTIPDSVTTIGESAFRGCSSLTSVTIPDSVTKIGESAFCGCYSLTSVTIPDSVTTIGYSVFGDCSSLQEFNGKFTSEDGRCLIIDGTLNSFAPAGLTEYTIPNSVTTIGDYALHGCSSLTSVTIPDSVTSIGTYAFCGCNSLISVTIPDSVTTIGNYAFYSCSSLTSVTIPDSVTTIGDHAFAYCGNLTSVYCKPTTPPAVTLDYFYDWEAFDYNAWDREIYVPMESVEAYKSANGWSEYKSYIVGYDF